MRPLLVFLCLVVALSAAGAAELPSRDAKSAPPKTKRCEIGGQPGFLAADGQTCIRISGYVSGQMTSGALK